MTELLVRAATDPLATRSPDPKAEQRRARMLWWQRNVRQVQALAIILGIILIVALCRMAYLFGLFEAIFHFGG